MVSGSDDFTMFLWSPSTSKQPVARMTGHVQTVNQVGGGLAYWLIWWEAWEEVWPTKCLHDQCRPKRGTRTSGLLYELAGRGGPAAAAAAAAASIDRMRCQWLFPIFQPNRTTAQYRCQQTLQVLLPCDGTCWWFLL